MITETLLAIIDNLLVIEIDVELSKLVNCIEDACIFPLSLSEKMEKGLCKLTEKNNYAEDFASESSRDNEECAQETV